MQMLRVSDIRTDGGTQPRAELNWLVIEDYASQMEEGAQFPAVSVFYDGDSYWLADGFHRVAAAKKLGFLSIAAEVRQGTRDDAVIASCGANATHGLRRSNADKVRAVETLLQLRPQWSNEKIAQHCAVGKTMVLDHRRLSGGLNDHLNVREGKDGKLYPVAPKPSKPLLPAIQTALTDLVFQAPDEAAAFTAKALDERLASDAIEHIQRIITDPQTPETLLEHILQPGEMVHDRQGQYAPSEPLRAFAQAVTETPESHALPMDLFIRHLSGCRPVSDDVVAAWLDVASHAEVDLAEEILDRVETWVTQVKCEIAARKRHMLRAMPPA